MKDSSTFAALNGYREQVCYDAHHVIWLLTPDGVCKIVLFAARENNTPMYGY